MKKTSLNNNLILTPYRKTRELKETQAATGFSMTANKVGIDYLVLLVDAMVDLSDNSIVLSAGTKIYFKEDTLYTQKWPRQVFDSEDFEDGFVVGNIRDALFFEGE